MWVEVTSPDGHAIMVNLEHVECVRPANPLAGDNRKAKCVLMLESGHSQAVTEDYAHMRALVMH